MPTCICPIIGCKAHKGRHDTCVGCSRTQNIADGRGPLGQSGRGCPWCRERRLEAVKEPTHDEQLTPAEEVMIDTAREKEWELEDSVTSQFAQDMLDTDHYID